MRGETLVEPTRAIRCFERNLHLGHVGLQPDGVAIFSPPALETVHLCSKLRAGDRRLRRTTQSGWREKPTWAAELLRLCWSVTVFVSVVYCAVSRP